MFTNLIQSYEILRIVLIFVFSLFVFLYLFLHNSYLHEVYTPMNMCLCIAHTYICIDTIFYRAYAFNMSLLTVPFNALH